MAAAFAAAVLLGTASSTLALIPGPNPPVADAGADATYVASASGSIAVALDGTASYDPDSGDAVVDWQWSNGFGNISGAQPTVNLTVGTHLIYLVVTDSGGNVSAPDTVTITVTAPEGGGPTINPPAHDVTVECDGLGDNTALMAWINSHGGASATSPNGTITWSDNYSPALFVYNDAHCSAGHVTVVFTATDPAGKTASTSATFYVVDTTPPTLSWWVEGNPVNDSATYNVSNKDIPITITVVPTDLCGGATLTKHVATTIAGCANTTFTGTTFTITSATLNSSIKLIAQATDDCGNVSAQEWVIVKVVAPGKADCFAKGNEGLGNGEDPNTPGHIHNGGNDDPSYHPGNPGARNKHR